MSRFATVVVGEPGKDWRLWGLTPGALLLRNGSLYRIVGSCRGRQRLLLRKLEATAANPAWSGL